MQTHVRRFIKSTFAYLAIALMLSSALFVVALSSATAAGANLLANPSVETAATTPTMPANWTQDSWGTNTASFAWKDGAKDGSKSLYINMTNRSSGDAKWVTSSVTLKPNTQYTLSDWYISNVQTSLEVEYTHANGTITYDWLKNVAASTSWKQASVNFTTASDITSASFYHVIAKKGTLQTDAYELRDLSAPAPAPAPAAPTVTLTAPVNNATVSGTQTISATTTNTVGVQFKLDGTNLGAEDTTAPYSTTLDTKTIANGTHTISAVARNTGAQTATATATVTVNNVVTPPAPTAPTVTITAPANNATVSATQTVTANAADAGSISGVQFKLDGANLGSEDTTAPYTATWDTKTSTNGTHSLTAVARNNSNLSTTSSVVTVTVNNVVTPPTPAPAPAPTNIVANPSVETTETATKPAGWNADFWGTNTTAFSYLASGHTGSRSLKTEITTYTNGDAKWHFDDIPVVAGRTYQYSNWYQSNVDTEIDAAVTMNDGTTQYFYLTTASASTPWAKVSAQFTIPVDAKSITIFQVLAKKGFVITDDFLLSEYTPAGFNRAMVTLSFDDGWRSQYDNALPILTKYGMTASFYLLTSTIDYPDYMTKSMMQTLKNKGHELDSHTITHPHLPQLTTTQMDKELAQSQSDLRAWFGAGVADDFASPYGEYNTATLTEIKKYYRSHRSTDEGFNSKDNFDIYNVKVQNILYTTTAAQVKAWVEQAQRDHTWLVLVYHEVATAVEDPTYSISPADLDAQLAAIKANGIAVKNFGDALNEALSQL